MSVRDSSANSSGPGKEIPIYVRESPWVVPGEDLDFAATMQWAIRAEQLGFEGIFVADRLLSEAASDGKVVYDASAIDPVVLIAALSSVTTTLKLGTLVYVVPYRHPIQAAKTLASLDAVSGGRLVLGAGLGWNAREFEALGLNAADRGSRFEDALGLYRELWSGERVTHDGQWWSFENIAISPRPHRAGGPPIWLASFAPSHSLDFSEGFSRPIERALRRVGRLADAWVPLTYSASSKRRISAEHLGEAWKIVQSSAAETEHERQVEFVHADWVYVLDGPNANKRCQKGLDNFFHGSWEDALNTYIIGTADEVVEKLHAQSECMDGGADAYVLTCLSPEPEQLELLSESVSPVLQKA